MQIFGHIALTADELWKQYSTIIANSSIWEEQHFQASAKSCSFKHVNARRSYFSFTGPARMKGQAPTTAGFVEELRLFLSEAPRDIDVQAWETDSPKLELLAHVYVDMFRTHLGEPRKKNQNEIFEHEGIRVRVLNANNAVWVVISNLTIVRELGIDYWA